MLQTLGSAEGQVRGVPCSATCSLCQSGPWMGCLRSTGNSIRCLLSWLTRNWLKAGRGPGNKSLGFFCFKRGGQTYNSLTTSSCFHPASPLSAEFCQETGTKHQLKTSYAFSVKQKRNEVGGEDDGKGGRRNPALE